MLSKSANPSLATPSQAPIGEGVETGWEPPDRVTAKVKAQSRPRTLGAFGWRRKPQWHGIRRVLVRAQEGQLEARCDDESCRASCVFGAYKRFTSIHALAPPGLSPHHLPLTFLSRSFTGLLITSSLPSGVAH